MPRPVVFEGQRLPASYANFYIANGLVLVPTFNDPADRVALDTLARLFPDREVVGHPQRRPGPRPGDVALPVAAAAGRIRLLTRPSWPRVHFSWRQAS